MRVCGVGGLCQRGYHREVGKARDGGGAAAREQLGARERTRARRRSKEALQQDAFRMLVPQWALAHGEVERVDEVLRTNRASAGGVRRLFHQYVFEVVTAKLPE